MGQYLVLVKRTGPGRDDSIEDDRLDVIGNSYDMRFYNECDEIIEFYDGYGDSPDYYCRPKDFNKIREWVKDSISGEGNQQRLFDLLALMEQESDLWVTYG